MNYINKKLKKVSKKELLRAIAKVEKKNKEIDKKSKFSNLDLLVKCDAPLNKLQ